MKDWLVILQDAREQAKWDQPAYGILQNAIYYLLGYRWVDEEFKWVHECRFPGYVKW